MKPILVVEDDADVQAAVGEALVRHGFSFLIATSVRDARRMWSEAELVLLDLGLPDGDGLELCSELAGRVPLIVVSARGDEADRVVALEFGADDYLAKPFSTRELVARCRSVLRRTAHWTHGTVYAADIEIDLDHYEVRRGRDVIILTTKEIEVMICLAKRLNIVVRREELANEVWKTTLGPVSRTLDAHVSSLRRKLGRGPTGHGYIDTTHGVGYRLVP